MNLDSSVEFAGGRATITLVGDVAVESTSVVRDLLQTNLHRPGITTVVVDLSGVTFLDSSALGVLVAARKSAVQRGVTFGVQNPGPMVTMVLQITGLSEELIIAPSLG